MSELRREYLKGSIVLAREPEGKLTENFKILSVVGEGGSCICYDAIRYLPSGEQETGKLKEFYPEKCCTWISRAADGQLAVREDEQENFEVLCTEQREAHQLLNNACVQNKKNEILKNYFQSYQVLFGQERETSAESGLWAWVKGKKSSVHQGSIYFWTSGAAGQGFDLYLKKIRKHPERKRGEKLLEILTVIRELTDCTKALHAAGLIHGDIKPANFLVEYDSDGHIKANNISLFDISSLQTVQEPKLFYSEGYGAPEIERGSIDFRSDIYSIGATLFYALVIHEAIEDGKYNPRYYYNINRLVKDSGLFQEEYLSDVRFLSLICRILSRCLARHPESRYQNCGELKADLKKAIKRLQILLNSPVEHNRIGRADPTVAMQKLLYEHPLYDEGLEGKRLNVLVLGAGTYGQKFIDICLQAAQMDETMLQITAVSSTAEEDRESYVGFRPAMSEFVNINGSLDKHPALAYASLDFREVPAVEDNEKTPRFVRKKDVNREIIRKLFDAAGEQSFHYVFIALGEDKLNKSLANLVAEELEYSCPVSYVCWSKPKSVREDRQNKIFPVWVNEQIELTSITRDLGEMAFNAHIAWDPTLSTDMADKRKHFFEGETETERYERRSSIAYALSVKYKLHCVGIDCRNPQLAAQRFENEILNAMKDPAKADTAKEKFDRLVYLEHRRWVLDRAAEGWSAPRDEQGRLKLADCVTLGKVRNDAEKLHPCMVHGTSRQVLSTEEYTKNHHAKWDEEEIDPSLDELDRMSIELHQCFRRASEKLKIQSLYQDANLLAIRNMIPENLNEVEREFGQFRFALKNIINGVESYSRQYDHYEKAFRKSLEVLEPAARKTIGESLDVIRRKFFPLVQSNLYTDYKANDDVLIRNIPFILTYRYQKTLGMAFSTGQSSNEQKGIAFANVASATMLCPEKLCYLYCYEKNSVTDLLIDGIGAAVRYFRMRKVHCSIELLLLVMEDVPEKKRKRLEDGLAKLSDKLAREQGSVSFRLALQPGVKNHEEANELFCMYLQREAVQLFDISNMPYPGFMDNKALIDRFGEEKMPVFQFNFEEKKFDGMEGCEYLRYAKNSVFLHIQEMFALKNAQNEEFYFPEFADDYEALWEIYTNRQMKKGNPDKNFENGVRNWNTLCMLLEEYERNRETLIRIPMNFRDKAPEFDRELAYYLPEFTYTTVKMLLAKLSEYKLIAADSYVINHTSDTCRLVVRTNERYEKELNKLFTGTKYLLPYYGMQVVPKETNYFTGVTIDCSRLTVTNLSLTSKGDAAKYLYNILLELEKKHFIRGLTKDKDNCEKVSFEYSSPRIKHLLTQAGMILEIYAYYEILKTGYFDDVATGYECSSSFYDGNKTISVKNELDLVLTKGFKSVFVECKAVAVLNQEYYYKLDSLADYYGVAVRKVLLGNTYVHSDKGTALANEIQVYRGRRLNIVTITDREQIEHIGETMIALLEEE